MNECGRKEVKNVRGSEGVSEGEWKSGRVDGRVNE